jgi:predicted RNA methylase
MTVDNPFYSIIPAFKQRVLSVDPTQLSAMPYPLHYFENIRGSIDYTLKTYADLLHHTQQFSNRSIAQSCLFDYGAGNGILGLFAKFVGYGKVILIERDSDFLAASIRLSE